MTDAGVSSVGIFYLFSVDFTRRVYHRYFFVAVFMRPNELQGPDPWRLLRHIITCVPLFELCFILLFCLLVQPFRYL